MVGPKVSILHSWSVVSLYCIVGRNRWIGKFEHFVDFGSVGILVQLEAKI